MRTVLFVALVGSACATPRPASAPGPLPERAWASPESPPTAHQRRPIDTTATLPPITGDTPQRCTQLLPTAKRIARQHRIDVGLMVGIMRVESRFRPEAKNRRSGATGLMQIMPSTGKYFDCGDLAEPAANMDCGARVLRRYIDYFDGSVTYGIAAYHAGPRSPARARKKGRLPRNFHYVQKVMKWRTRFLRKGCF